MQGSCVNLLNKTVNNVCKLEQQINSNTTDVTFLKKYMNFNKNLLLSMMGTRVETPLNLTAYNIDSKFYQNAKLDYFLSAIVDFLNNNYGENHYLYIQSKDDIPNICDNLNIKIPSILQLSFVEPDVSAITDIIDSVRFRNFTTLGLIVNQLNEYSDNPTYFATSILEFLAENPDINLVKQTTIPLTANFISGTYNNILSCKKTFKSRHSMRVRSFKGLDIKNTIDTVNFYLKKGSENVVSDYKKKSFNDPYYPPPTHSDYIEEARKLLNSDYYLNDEAQYNSDQPYEPSEPAQPSEPSDINVTISIPFYYKEETKSDDTTTKSDNVENKIKMLLELTDTAESV